MRTDATAEDRRNEVGLGRVASGLRLGGFGRYQLVTGGRVVNSRGTRLLAAAAVIACIGFASAAMAAVSPQDQKCLTEFAAGKLSNTTPEGCVRSDPNGKLSKAAQKAVNVINQQCGTLPAF